METLSQCVVGTVRVLLVRNCIMFLGKDFSYRNDGVVKV